MSQQQRTLKEAGTVEASEALRLEQEKVEQIVEALNSDLADAYVLYHQLRKHHWNVEGAEFRDLHLFLGEAAEDAEAAADELAERVQALGGVPHASGATLEANATVDPEDENVYDIRTSLARDMEIYGEIIETTRGHIELTEELGDHASAQMLREQLIGLEEAAHHIEHYLENDTLVTEGAMQ